MSKITRIAEKMLNALVTKKTASAGDTWCTGHACGGGMRLQFTSSNGHITNVRCCC